MSLLRTLSACALALLIAGCVTIPAPASADVGISFDFFYSNLEPSGRWLVSGEYGRVWQPAEYRSGWSPYYDGHWTYTDVGWAWVSDYEWGSIPYHYGTWTVDADLGWVWVPGYVWAPAWVVFSSGPDYIGWAPVPVGYSVGTSIDVSVYAPERFVFVASRDFLAPRVRGYAVPARDTRVIINNTRIENTIRVENNVVVNNGPDVSIVQRASGRRIEAEPIERVPRLGPRGRMTRADLTVDAAGPGTRLRAAEPISEQDSDAAVGRGRNESRRPGARDNQPRSTAPEPGAERRRPHSGPGFEGQAAPDDRRADPSDQPRRQPDNPRGQSDDSSGGGVDRSRPADQEPPDERRMRPNRQRRPDESNDPERVSSDDSRAKADADAKEKAKAQEKAQEKERGKPRKKAKPKPTPPPGGGQRG